MHLGCCLVASDLNDEYINFYPIVHRTWLKLLGIRAKLVLIADEIPHSLKHLSDDIFLFPPLPHIHSAFQAQCIRLLYPALLEREANGGAVLISDIDMIPMNQSYYAGSIAQLPDDSFVAYRGNVLMSAREIPICYNAARPATWSALFGTISSIEDVRRRLSDWFSAFSAYDGKHGGAEWNADQRILHDAVMAWQTQKNGRVVLLDDDATGYRRLDRAEISHIGGLTTEHMARVRAGAYSDCHMMRPHARHRRINHAIATMLFERFPKAPTPTLPTQSLIAASLAVVMQHTDGPVLEIGCDPSSTPLLNALCLAQSRHLASVDESAEKFEAYPGMRHALHETIVAPWKSNSMQRWALVVINGSYARAGLIEHFRRNADVIALLPCENRDAETLSLLGRFHYLHKDERAAIPTVFLSETLDVESLFL